MTKTTNILDLNNRLEKVEKENVAQNSYTSLKNKPKINSVTLTGNKSLADIGAAAAGDITDINTAIGDMSDLDTIATDLVGAINEVNEKADNINSGDFRYYPIVTTDNYAAFSLPKANAYNINLVTFLGSDAPIPEAVDGVTDGYNISVESTSSGYISLSLVGSYVNNAGRALRVLVNIQ